MIFPRRGYRLTSADSHSSILGSLIGLCPRLLLTVIASMDAIPSLAMLKELVRELERLAGNPAA